MLWLLVGNPFPPTAYLPPQLGIVQIKSGIAGLRSLFLHVQVNGCTGGHPPIFGHEALA